mgnify:CR=1 FL=1
MRKRVGRGWGEGERERGRLMSFRAKFEKKIEKKKKN